MAVLIMAISLATDSTVTDLFLMTFLTLFSRFCLSPRTTTGAVAGMVAAVTLIPGSAIAQDRSMWLTDNEDATLQGYFLRGEDIYAICDDDCTNLDLFLYDENGTIVDMDEAPDAFPIVTAPYEGTFRLKVTMPSCNHSAGCAASVSSDYGF